MGYGHRRGYVLHQEVWSGGGVCAVGPVVAGDVAVAGVGVVVELYASANADFDGVVARDEQVWRHRGGRDIGDVDKPYAVGGGAGVTVGLHDGDDQGAEVVTAPVDRHLAARNGVRHIAAHLPAVSRDGGGSGVGMGCVGYLRVFAGHEVIGKLIDGVVLVVVDAFRVEVAGHDDVARGVGLVSQYGGRVALRQSRAEP